MSEADSDIEMLVEFQDDDFDNSHREEVDGDLDDERVQRADRTSQAPVRDRISEISVSYGEVINELKRITKVLTKIDAASSKQVKEIKKQLKTLYPWNSMILTLQAEAGLRGLSQESLILLWRVASSLDTNVNVVQRRKLIFCLVPESQKIDVVFLEEMLNCIFYFTSKDYGKFKPRSFGASIDILQYLNGLMEYDLVSSNILRTPFIYGLIFNLHTTDALIPWLCQLLMKTTTKELVQRCYVSDLTDFVKKDLNNLSKQSILDLLRYFKILRPDLVPPDDLSKIIMRKGVKKIDLDPTLRKCLYEASLRHNGQGRSQVFLPETDEELHNKIKNKMSDMEIKDLFFAEFPLQVENTNLFSREIFESMSYQGRVMSALTNTATLNLITKNPEYLEVYNDWISVVFRQKFARYMKKELCQYKFFLRRCIEITFLTDKGLTAVDDWLPDYLLSWDMCFMKEEILTLFSFLNPMDFEDGFEAVFDTIETIFLDGDEVERIDVWFSLSRLTTRWAKLSLEDSTLKPLLKQLIDFVNSLVVKLIATDEITEALLIVFCSTYEKLLEMQILRGPAKEVDWFPPLALWWSVVFSDSVLAWDKFCGFFIELQKLKIPKKGPQAGFIDVKLMKKEVETFFSKDGSGLTALFKNEHKLLHSFDEGSQILSANEHNFVKRSKQKFQDCLDEANVNQVDFLDQFCTATKEEVLLNKKKLQPMAPHLVFVLESFGYLFK